ncbi:MAG TPA: class I SAM-dependent methyltransferase [Candidatus Sulfotelmatobacter sp.]|nr:class I SAM-dependent methyltransferase [Candidatus Sulfotelmatobacter sp.]
MPCITGDVVLVVLDLGCGAGCDLNAWGIAASDKVVGIDIDKTSLAIAKTRFCDRSYIQASGACLPFKNGSFDRVIAAVSLPYMKIPQALGEVHRILVPAGRLSLSLHPPSFTAAELLHHAIPKAIPTIFRLYVIANGLVFHFSGRVVGFLKRRTESFQTERGMRIALARAKFTDFSFRNGKGPFGKTFIVEARTSETGDALPTTHAKA